MPRPVSVEITPQDGPAFFAEIANLTARSMFVKTELPLRFRDRVSITFFDVTFAGEVVHRNTNAPAGAVVIFEAPQPVRDAINATLDEVENLDAHQELFAERTAPYGLSEQDIIDLATPDPAPDDDPDTSRYAPTEDVSILDPVEEALPMDAIIDEAVAGSSAPARVTGEAGGGSSPLPALADDGVTIAFSSPLQYRTQYEANIAYGGIIVRGQPLPIGMQKFLAIQIPGRARYTVGARVTFIGDGTIGFMIDSFPIHRTALKGFAG